MDVLRYVPGYEHQMLSTGRLPVLLLLLAFLVTFFLTRLYARLARSQGWGSGSVNGVHLHHLAVGIPIVLISGLIEIAVRPGRPGAELLAIAFGIGGAFILDEFALWLYLRDVYWSAEGHRSIDASLMGVVLSALFLVGTAPFGVHASHGESRIVVFVMIAVNVVLALITFAKGKLTLGLIGVFVPLVALVCAVRIAKPHSLWARRFYDERKLQRAIARYEGDSWMHRLHERFDGIVGGAPTMPMMPLQMEVVRGCLAFRDET